MRRSALVLQVRVCVCGSVCLCGESKEEVQGEGEVKERGTEK